MSAKTITGRVLVRLPNDRKYRSTAVAMCGASVAKEFGVTPEEQAILDNQELAGAADFIIRHEAYHAYMNDSRSSVVGTDLVFRRLGDLLGKGERAVGMIVDGSDELLEYVGFNDESLMTAQERAAIVALLEQECLDGL